ncbi:hypothetical protein HRI_002754800 [Hibiscus trionum]|nr:hypothetical protein HRI_002754800 [Hibiscus trionum]
MKATMIALSSYDQSNNNDYECFEARGDLEFLNRQYSNDVDEDTEYDHNEEEDYDDEFDLDDFSYEELIALGEIIGVEKRRLSGEEISSCLVPFKLRVICEVEYKEDEGLVALPNCEHPCHSDCISKWLQIKKNCPICSIEISSSNNVV